MLNIVKILGSMLCKLKMKVHLRTKHWLHTEIQLVVGPFRWGNWNNSQNSGNGATVNFLDNEKRRDI